MAKKSKQRRSRTEVRSVAAADSSWWENPFVRAAALLALVLVAYGPVWSAGFVWDDELLTAGDPLASRWQNLRDIWTSSAADICPLTLTTFWIERGLWGAHPLPYHLVTVLFHAGAAVALWRVLRRMRIPGAWLGAALWALHPVMVESVAWISEMKNTQSAIFYLLAILFFLRGETPGARGRNDYLLSLVFAGLAIASKTSTVMLPAVLLLCAWWRDGRFSARQLLRVSPIVAVALADILFSVWTQQARADLRGGYAPRSWPERLVTAGDAIWFYLGKLAWPHPLIVMYPRWIILPGQVVAWLPLAAAVGLTGVLWYGRDAWARPWFLVWSYFVVALLPVVGLAQMVYFQFSFVADHFQYLAAMGPLALAGAGVARVAAVAGRPWGAGLATVLLLLLGGLSCQRAAIYQNKSVFWNDLLGRPHDAEAEFRQKVALDPRDDTAHIDLGNVLLGEQQTAAALEEFRTAVRLKPGSVIDHYDLANGLMAARDLAAAEAEFRTAINLNPSFGDAHANLGTVLAQRGDLDGAIREYRIAAVLQPTAGDDFYNLGVLLERKGDLDGAIAALQTAVRLTPGNAAFADTLTQALNARPTPAR